MPKPPYRDLLKERGGSVDPAEAPEPPLDAEERMDQAIDESFPASDPPSWNSGVDDSDDQS